MNPAGQFPLGRPVRVDKIIDLSAFGQILWDSCRTSKMVDHTSKSLQRILREQLPDQERENETGERKASEGPPVASSSSSCRDRPVRLLERLLWDSCKNHWRR